MTPVLDTGGVALDPARAKRLEKAAKKAVEWRQERDRLIKDAYEAGGGVREIARLVGMSHPGVKRILHQLFTPPEDAGPTDVFLAPGDHDEPPEE